MSVFALAPYACLPNFGPVSMNILFPLNAARRKQLPAPAEYFVDEEKYFYTLFLHGMICYIFVPILYVNIDSMYACIMHHTVGLVGIVTYRLQYIIDLEVTSYQEYYANNLEIRKRLKRSITLHKEFIEFAEKKETTYSLCFMIVMFVNLFAMIFTAACGYSFRVSRGNKRIMQIMMIRCSQPCQLTAGSLLVLNIENFGAL
ncbi:hypothetical protein TSAR_007072 [Trichomalopsis sarcophagae]|uniref:Odorant receptor n=1 Tax=Trichomalopsis sarcophagae TaxID=543379 RepID=A0A232FNG9_9HYME|nr:hypothetical protein TSAR_007072 [Trichomalopsis sarcophagae]